MTDSLCSPDSSAAHASEGGPEHQPQQGQQGASLPEEGRFVLPLVVRLERTAPPTRTDAMDTAARAVLTFLADPRTAGESGVWHERVRLWEERGIRKVVRRARGSEWRRTEPLEKITLAERTAEIRVFPPVPLDGWPKELSRLQVSGTDLEDPEPPHPPEPGTPVLWLNPALEMTAGKAMAQAAHGAQLAWWELAEPARRAWYEAGFPLAVRPARDAGHWSTLTTSGLPVVQDAGFTEIEAGPTVAVEGHHRFGSPPRPPRT